MKNMIGTKKHCIRKEIEFELRSKTNQPINRCRKQINQIILFPKSFGSTCF